MRLDLFDAWTLDRPEMSEAFLYDGSLVEEREKRSDESTEEFISDQVRVAGCLGGSHTHPTDRRHNC